jgi:hypothetical protein
MSRTDLTLTRAASRGVIALSLVASTILVIQVGRTSTFNSSPGPTPGSRLPKRLGPVAIDTYEYTPTFLLVPRALAWPGLAWPGLAWPG